MINKRNFTEFWNYLKQLVSFRKTASLNAFISTYFYNLFLTFKTAYKPNAIIYHNYISTLLNDNVTQEKIKTMLEAQQSLKNTFCKKRYYRNLYAYRHHFFLGKMYELLGNHKQNEEEYFIDYQILTNFYNNATNIITDNFNKIISKLAIIKVKLKKPRKASGYLRMHKQMFCDNHPMSLKLVRYFVEKKVSVKI